MDWLQAIVLGIVQGLTEFLPVSSSGHLAIGKALLGVETSGDLIFEVTVHAATVIATIVVFRKEKYEKFDFLTIFHFATRLHRRNIFTVSIVSFFSKIISISYFHILFYF